MTRALIEVGRMRPYICDAHEPWYSRTGAGAVDQHQLQCKGLPCASLLLQSTVLVLVLHLHLHARGVATLRTSCLHLKVAVALRPRLGQAVVFLSLSLHRWTTAQDPNKI
jgi:hypothetical protein